MWLSSRCSALLSWLTRSFGRYGDASRCTFASHSICGSPAAGPGESGGWAVRAEACCDKRHTSLQRPQHACCALWDGTEAQVQSKQASQSPGPVPALLL